MANPAQPPVPLGNILLTADMMRDPETAAQMLNQIIVNLTQQVNKLQGAKGAKITLTGPLDMSGYPILNVGNPPTVGKGRQQTADPTAVVTVSHADQNYSAPALRPQIESTGETPLKSYRQLSNPYQQESNSSHLNRLANTAPSGNSSTVTFGAVSGGFVAVTISGGSFTRADGSKISYPASNDSLPLATSFAIATLSRASGTVTGSTSGAHTLIIGENVTVVITAGDSSFNGSFVLLTASTPNFSYVQDGPDGSAATGSPPVLSATINLLGVYYYGINPKIGNVFRVGSFSADTLANRISASKDGTQIIAVVTVDGSGGVLASTAGGGTSPVQNIGGANPIIFV